MERFSRLAGACSLVALAGAGSALASGLGTPAPSASSTRLPSLEVSLTVTVVHGGTAGSTGQGSVGSVPAGISSCTATCVASFPRGAHVKLTVHPVSSDGSYFEYWSGARTVSAHSCTVVMHGAQTVSATLFNEHSGT